MRKLTREQFLKMDGWMRKNARAYDLAKWDFLFHGGSRDAIVSEMCRYQNPDGGLGSGFEPDVICPVSAAIPTAEAIFQAYEYNLDCGADWFKTNLAYFENSVRDIPKYWEDSPREAMDYPHAPWWSYAPCTVFNPNPCAVVASAMIRYGSASQRELGYKIADDCFRLLRSNDFCGDHDTLNLQALVEQLAAKGVEFVSQKEAIDTMTPSGKFMLTIFGAVAELEREYLLQRQREGISIAKAQGAYKGRHRLERPEFDRIVQAWRDGKLTEAEVLEKLKISKSTFYRRLREGRETQ